MRYGRVVLAFVGVFLLATVAFGQKVIRLKFASYFPTAASQSKLLEEFCRDVEKRTNGTVKVDFYGGEALLSATKVYDGVVQGIADIGFSHVAYTVGRFPITELADLPHGYPSAWVSTHVVNDFYERYKPEEWKDTKVLWLNTQPPQVLILAKKPVYKLEDLKGLTIRGTGRTSEILKALGAVPKPVPMPETYEAISRGVVEGSMTAIETLKSFRLAEVAKYVTLCYGVADVYTFYVVMNKRTWESLPGEVQKVFDELSKEYREKAARVWNDVDFEGLKAGKEKGVTFINLTEDEMKKWQEAVQPVVEAYLKELEKAGHSRAKLNEMISYIKERTRYWLDRQKELGIKSVTGPKEIRAE